MKEKEIEKPKTEKEIFEAKNIDLNKEFDEVEKKISQADSEEKNETFKELFSNLRNEGVLTFGPRLPTSILNVRIISPDGRALLLRKKVEDDEGKEEFSLRNSEDTKSWLNYELKGYREKIESLTREKEKLEEKLEQIESQD